MLGTHMLILMALKVHRRGQRLGLLDVQTVMKGPKTLVEIQGLTYEAERRLRGMKCTWA